MLRNEIWKRAHTLSMRPFRFVGVNTELVAFAYKIVVICLQSCRYLRTDTPMRICYNVFWLRD